MTSLHIAVYYESLELTKSLLEELKAANPALLSKSVNLRLPQYGTPLFAACNKRNVALIDLLVSYGADLKQPQGPVSAEPIVRLAVMIDDQTVVASLVRHGAEIDAAGEAGHTALIWAAYNGSYAMVQQLLNLGADPNKAADDGATPLHVAVHAASREVVLALLDAGARVDAGIGTEVTPLCMARDGGLVEISELLVERGGDVEYAQKLRAFEVEGKRYLIVADETRTEEQWERIKLVAMENISTLSASGERIRSGIKGQVYFLQA